MTPRPASTPYAPSRLAAILIALPPQLRGQLVMSAVAMRPSPTLELSFATGEVRNAFAELWEAKFASPLPITALRALLDPPLPIATVLAFNKLALADGAIEIDVFLTSLVQLLADRIRQFFRESQPTLFPTRDGSKPAEAKLPCGTVVSDLTQLVAIGRKFPTVYADPPWQYENVASRAAAINQYDTLSLDAICAEPVRELIADNAHLHLWTTNGFLREAFDVIEAWGFRFKSCLVWTKPEIGMGNYWRVSHEYLLLGVRGRLTFRDRTLPSWIHANRSVHSRKPGIIRAWIERVSPGPYLELYGREELPDSAWTVYGNQVDRRLF